MKRCAHCNDELSRREREEAADFRRRIYCNRTCSNLHRNVLRTRPPMERFLARVVRIDECELWMGSTDDNGYGTFYDGEKIVKVHRWIFEQRHGPLPAGLCVCHSCDTPNCTRDGHHFAGTHEDNMRDAAQKGLMSGWQRYRHPPGGWQAKRKLERAVMAWRALA